MKKLLLLFGLALLAPGRAAQAQAGSAGSRLLTGLVRDQRTAHELKNVVVTIKNDTLNYCLTDSTGRFRLAVPQAAGTTLEFRKYGYVLQEVPLADLAKPALKVWLRKPAPVWKSKKALARDSAQRAQAARQASVISPHTPRKPGR